MLNDFFYTQLAFAFAPQNDSYCAYLFFLLQLKLDIFLRLFLPFHFSFFRMILISFTYFFLVFLCVFDNFFIFIYRKIIVKNIYVLQKLIKYMSSVFKLCKFSELCTLYELNKLYELHELCKCFMNHLKSNEIT